MESLYTATTIVHVTQPVEHFDYDASPTIVNLGIENFHPIQIIEMSPTLQSLEQELSEILRESDILCLDSFV
jgi:hypothetical protein